MTPPPPDPAAGTVRVVFLDWVLGDGSLPPPRTGDRVAWSLLFREHAAGTDLTGQLLLARAEVRSDPDVDRGPVGTTWHTRLEGDGWRAHWRADRPCAGPVELTGALFVDPIGSPRRAVTGTVRELQVISEEVDDGRVVPGSVRLRPVTVSPRWLDRGPSRTPRASALEQGGSSGFRWLSAEEMEPLPRHRRETGVLVTLALDRPGVAARP